MLSCKQQSACLFPGDKVHDASWFLFSLAFDIIALALRHDQYVFYGINEIKHYRKQATIRLDSQACAAPVKMMKGKK